MRIRLTFDDNESFTAEEAYLAQEDLREREDSIFLSSLDGSYPQEWRNDDLIECWEKILSLRNQVLKEIEKRREKGEIGSSLEASVLITCEDKDYSFYKEYQSFLKEIFIVSSVSIETGNFAIKVIKASGKKCLRCWSWNEDIGNDLKYPDVCNKCLKSLLKEDDK